MPCCPVVIDDEHPPSGSQGTWHVSTFSESPAVCEWRTFDVPVAAGAARARAGDVPQPGLSAARPSPPPATEARRGPWPRRQCAPPARDPPPPEALAERQVCPVTPSAHGRSDGARLCRPLQRPTIAPEPGRPSEDGQQLLQRGWSPLRRRSACSRSKMSWAAGVPIRRPRAALAGGADAGMVVGALDRIPLRSTVTSSAADRRTGNHPFRRQDIVPGHRPARALSGDDRHVAAADLLALSDRDRRRQSVDFRHLHP